MSGTADKGLQRHIQEMGDNSNKIGMPMFDLIFRMFPFLRFLPFPITRKPFLVIHSIDKMMESMKRLTVSTMEQKQQYKYIGIIY